MQQGQAAALQKTTCWSWWRSWTGAGNAVLAAKTSPILGCVSKRVSYRSGEAILVLYLVVMRHLEYWFTTYNCQMGLFEKDGCRFFSEVHQNRNKGNRRWKFQLIKGKHFSLVGGQNLEQIFAQIGCGSFTNIQNSTGQDRQQPAPIGSSLRRRLYWRPLEFHSNLTDSMILCL